MFYISFFEPPTTSHSALFFSSNIVRLVYPSFLVFYAFRHGPHAVLISIPTVYVTALSVPIHGDVTYLTRVTHTCEPLLWRKVRRRERERERRKIRKKKIRRERMDTCLSPVHAYTRDVTSYFTLGALTTYLPSVTLHNRRAQ